MAKHILFIHGGGEESAYDEDEILAKSLQNALGPDFEVRYPKMPLEEGAGYADWKAHIAKEFSALDEDIILVAHSVGGSILLKYLSEEQVEKTIAGLFLLATPYFGGDENWNYPEMTLPQDFATKLPAIPGIFLYHSRDDEVVPFAHLALYAAKLPQAVVRISDGRGHQFANDLTEVAEDIKKAESSSGR